jgi:predicted NBD/HSP70 family sugar kinase
VNPAQALFDAADLGEPEAITVRDEVAGHLAAAVRMLVLTLDVEVVVLGGGVAELGPRLRSAVAAELERDQLASPFLRALGLPDRVVLVDGSVPVGALGAAFAGQQVAEPTAG